MVVFTVLPYTIHPTNSAIFTIGQQDLLLTVRLIRHSIVNYASAFLSITVSECINLHNKSLKSKAPSLLSFYLPIQFYGKLGHTDY